MAGLEIIKNLADPINNAVSQSTGSGTDALATNLNEVLSGWFRGNVFPLMTGAAIFVTVLFVFYGAFLYFTAYGDENKATQAKKTLTYAMVGFAISALAFSVANYSKRFFITKDYENSTANGGNTGVNLKDNPNAPITQESGGTIQEQNPYETENIITQ